MATLEDYEYSAFRCAFCKVLNPAKKIRPKAPAIENIGSTFSPVAQRHHPIEILHPNRKNKIRVRLPDSIRLVRTRRNNNHRRQK